MREKLGEGVAPLQLLRAEPGLGVWFPDAGSTAPSRGSAADPAHPVRSTESQVGPR